MKIIIALFFLIILSGVCQAQYYYKDLVVTGRTVAQWKTYRDSKVKGVRLISMEANGQPSEGFAGDQTCSADLSRITTHTRSSGTPESWILANYSPTGLPVKIVDTSDTYQSVSEYQFDPQSRLTTITNTSTETDNHAKEVETHLWTYTAGGKPSAMLKIRNGKDTTFVRFVTDEKGNIAEERATRNGSALPAVYYYYDDNGRLTDIVRFNARAGRLLPDYIFEYEDSDRPASMLVVPEGSNDYQKWVYSYSDKGLKVKESCFNRQKQLLGMIEYQYIYK